MTTSTQPPLPPGSTKLQNLDRSLEKRLIVGKNALKDDLIFFSLNELLYFCFPGPGIGGNKN